MAHDTRVLNRVSHNLLRTGGVVDYAGHRVARHLGLPPLVVTPPSWPNLMSSADCDR